MDRNGQKLAGIKMGYYFPALGEVEKEFCRHGDLGWNYLLLGFNPNFKLVRLIILHDKR